MSDVEGLLDVYRDTMARFRSNEGARQARMAVELRSREFLCVWVVYCLVHHSDKAAHPLLEAYGVCLRWADLRHLVLRDQDAWEALLNVRSYLAQNEAPGRPLFSLQTPLPTFAFAEAFALNGPDPAMRETWEKEKADAKTREDKYWAEVRRKQELATQLRAEIANSRQRPVAWRQRGRRRPAHGYCVLTTFVTIRAMRRSHSRISSRQPNAS